MNTFAINSVAVQGDGKILLAGDFNAINGQTRNRLARLNANGSLESTATFNNGTGLAGGSNQGSTRVLLQGNGQILVTGDFASVDGVPHGGIARLNPNGSIENPGTFNPGSGVNFLIRSAAVQGDGKIVIGGSFSSVDGLSRRNVARLNANGSVESAGTFAIGTGTNSVVDSVVAQADGKVLIGGLFTVVNGQHRNALARLNGDGSLESPGGFNIGTGVAGGLSGSVLGLAVQPDGKIVLGGYFTSVGGQPRKNIARLNPDGSVESTATFNPGAGPNDLVYCLAVQPDGKVLLGGSFTTVDGQPRGNIARLHADGTLESTATFNPGTGANSVVFSLAVQADGKILLGGFFTTVNGQPRGNIARLHADGTLESTTTFNPGTGTDNFVNSVAVQTDGKILLGGNFTTVDSQPRGAIARLLADGSVEGTATFNPGTGATGGNNFFVQVGSVAVQADGKILLAGDFTTVNGQPRNRIARLLADGSLESTTTFNPGSGVDGRVAGLGLQADGKIVLCGQFSSVNSQPRNGIARLLPNGSLESPLSFDFGSGLSFGLECLAVQADGSILLGGTFSTLSDQPRQSLAALANGAASQAILLPDFTQVFWQRGGTAPELSRVTFELSSDGGASWTLLGPGTRIAATPDWQSPAALTLPPGGLLRARGVTMSGYNGSSASLVEQVTAFGAVANPVVNTGGPVVAPDLPPGTKFLDFKSAPDIGVASGRIVTTDGRKLAAVFNERGEVLLHAQQTMPVGGGEMRVIAKLAAPTGDAVLATLDRRSGATAADDQVLFGGLQAGTPKAMARKGQLLAGLPGVKLKSFLTLDGNGQTTFFSSTLNGAGVTGRNNTAILAAKPPSGSAGLPESGAMESEVRVLVRKGDIVDGNTVRTVATLVGSAGTLAEGRWRGGPNSLGVRLTFTDKTQALYLIPAEASGPADWLLIGKSGTLAGVDLPAAELRSFQLPAHAPGSTVFDSLLRVGVGGIVRQNSRAVFDAQGVETRGPISLRLLAQTAGPAPAQSNVQRFLNTLAGLGRASTVIANATLPGQAVSRGTIFDARHDGMLVPIARLGEAAPGGGQFARFVSVAKPDGPGYGALVSALLRVSGRDGVSVRNRSALFGRDSTGTMRRLLRAGDLLESAGPGSTLKPVRSFVALAAAAGSIGAARGYDAAGRVNVLVTFTDRTQAVVSVQVP